MAQYANCNNVSFMPCKIEHGIMKPYDHMLDFQAFDPRKIKLYDLCFYLTILINKIGYKHIVNRSSSFLKEVVIRKNTSIRPQDEHLKQTVNISLGEITSYLNSSEYVLFKLLFVKVSGALDLYRIGFPEGKIPETFKVYSSGEQSLVMFSDLVGYSIINAFNNIDRNSYDEVISELYNGNSAMIQMNNSCDTRFD